MVVEERDPGHGNGTQCGLWPCGCEPRCLETGIQAPVRLSLAALWRHLLGNLQSASEYQLVRRKRGQGPADQRGAIRDPPGPTWSRAEAQQRGQLPSCGREHLGMEGRARPSVLRKGEWEHYRIQDLVHTSLIKLYQALDISGETRHNLGGGCNRVTAGCDVWACP